MGKAGLGYRGVAACRFVQILGQSVKKRDKSVLDFDKEALIGDGFPNDYGYKRECAVADTRKVILETASRHISTRVITVNISNITGLDEVYGIFRYNVISRVHHLPGKLLNLYSTLTK